MRFRNSRLRTKIVALLVSLTALWAFAAWVTLREGVNLLWVSTLDSTLASPSDPLLVELQRERRATVIRIAAPGTAQRAALDQQRARTDKARATVVREARSDMLDMAASEALKVRVREMLARLNALDTARRAADGGSLDRTQTIATYSETIESVFRAYDEMSSLDDEEIAKTTRTLVELNRSWEVLSQEDALVTGALTSGRLTPAEQIRFTQLTGARQQMVDRALGNIQRTDPTLHQRFTHSARFIEIRRMEEQLVQQRRASGRVKTQPQAVTLQQWSSTTDQALVEMRREIQAGGDRIIDQAKPVAIGTVLRLLLAGGLGLLAVIASVVVSITTARALFRQLEKLRKAAHELSDERLPRVVERLGHGEKVDIAVEAPPLRFGDDEIGQVGQAFNTVQETAIRTAVEQAELRRGVRDVLLSLARRSQTLVHRQLSMLDQMERRRDIDPKHLEELFRLDHLATRMRRNAENLIVLSGALPARGWRRPVPMVDVVRAAIGEVEDYTRVSVLPFGPLELSGRAVGDITHLLAELIENAVSFSPPDTVVQIGGHVVASGFAIDIEDRGLGMADVKLADLNNRIANPPEFNMQSSVQLGLFVVGKLAERYGLTVRLKPSAYGGTTAVVVIPQELLERSPEPAHVPAGALNGRAALPETPVRPPVLTAVPTPNALGQPSARDSGGHRMEEPPPPPRIDGATPGGLPRRASSPEQPHEPVPAPPAATPDAADHDDAEEKQRTVPEDSITPGGLPVRVPQASLAPPLRTDEPLTTGQPEAEPEQHRSPAEIQRIMGSYQRGTKLGRTAATRAEPSQDGTTSEGEDDQ